MIEMHGTSRPHDPARRSCESDRGGWEIIAAEHRTAKDDVVVRFDEVNGRMPLE